MIVVKANEEAMRAVLEAPSDSYVVIMDCEEMGRFNELQRAMPDVNGDGDMDAQAEAWRCVWKALAEVGIYSFIDRLDDNGMLRAVKFIHHLKERVVKAEGKV